MTDPVQVCPQKGRQLKSVFRLPLFVKYLLVLIPVFLSLSFLGLQLFTRYDLHSMEAELATRIGHQAARTATALARYPTAVNSQLADDLLAPLASDRAIVCVEWRAVTDRRILATLPPVIGCTGQDHSQVLSLEVGADTPSTLDIVFTNAEVIRTAQLKQNFLLLVFGTAFLMAVVSASIGFHLIVGRRLRRLHVAIRQGVESTGPVAVEGGGRDELGEVISAFNDMMSREAQSRSMLVKSNQELSASKQALLDLNSELDARVNARTQELTAAKARAEAANEAKSEFLANMSHELRTPLHGILSFAALGLDRLTTAKPDRIGHYLGKIHVSGKILLDLLNDLLDLAKLEAGKMTFDFRPVDLRSVLMTVNNEFQTLLLERSLTLHYEVPQSPLFVSIDTQRFIQVLRNLLSNAIKFSPPEGVITLHLSHDEKAVQVKVQDQGPGFPPDELETIFEKFTQSSATQTGAGGTGLGLSICREIMEAHHGRIWAQNDPSGGAVLTCKLARVSLETVIPSPDDDEMDSSGVPREC